MDDPASLSAPTEMETERKLTFGRKSVSPVPPLAPPREVASDPEDDGRPITPKPLSFRKKPRGSSFSIYEDDEDDEMTRRQESYLQESPMLTLTKPNSHGEIKLNPKGFKSSPTSRAPDSPNRPFSFPLQPSTTNRRPRASTLDSDFEDRQAFEEEAESNKKVHSNSALYAEIRRLQRLVDFKNEEALQTRRELELAKSMANAGTLSQMVRETQEDVKVWRNRAEWAEKQLRERGTRPTLPPVPFVKGHAHRYSMT